MEIKKNVHIELKRHNYAYSWNATAEDWPPLVAAREKPVQHEDPAQPKNKINTMSEKLTSSLLTPLFEKTYLENFRQIQLFLQTPA